MSTFGLIDARIESFWQRITCNHTNTEACWSGNDANAFRLNYTKLLRATLSKQIWCICWNAVHTIITSYQSRLVPSRHRDAFWQKFIQWIYCDLHYAWFIFFYESRLLSGLHSTSPFFAPLCTAFYCKGGPVEEMLMLSSQKAAKFESSCPELRVRLLFWFL